ncbi:hypothetical protein BGZ74_003211, partial [Mortierella antarctica]
VTQERGSSGGLGERGGGTGLPPRKPVTPASIERHRRLAARALSSVIDAEFGKETKPSWVALFRHEFKSMLTAVYWSERFEHTEDEILVDAGLLSWAYLEVGIIKTIGGLVTYFTVFYREGGITPAKSVQMQKDNQFSCGSPQENLDLLAKAQSCFFLRIMVMQLLNLFACKARYRLPFSKYMFSNVRTFWGILLGCALGFLIVNDTPFAYLLIPMAFGVFSIFYATMRILFLRRFRPTTLNDEIVGLNMFPMIRSTDSKTIPVPTS